MNHTQIMLKLICGLLFCVPINNLAAQQSKVDSVINLLKKSKTEKGTDTANLILARQLINTSILTDYQIGQLENASEQFKKGNDEDICYLVKFAILESLTTSDKSKAIDYGRFKLKRIENSKTPNKQFLTNNFLRQLRLPYRNSDRLPEGFQFFTEKLNNYKNNKDSANISICYYVLSGFYRTTGLMDQAIYNMKKSLSYLDTTKIANPNFFGLSSLEGKIGWINNTAVVGDYYLLKGDLEKSLKYSTTALDLTLAYYKSGAKDPSGVSLLFAARNIALVKILSNKSDSVDYFLNMAENAIKNPPNYVGQAVILQIRAQYKILTGSLPEADSLLQQCWRLINQRNITVITSSGIVAPEYYLALVRIKQNKFNDAIALLLKDITRIKNVRSDVLRDYKLLAELYEKTGDNLKAKETYKSFISLHDSVLSDQNKYRTISFETEQQINEKELSISKLENENKISSLSRNFSIGIAVLLLIIAAGVYYRFRSKQKANMVLEKTLSYLKSTQSQLIQSEKMASLGELTAGIAHEIQNPLNFVNNFSEVNRELLVEMKDEIKKGNLVEVNALVEDVIVNEEKINHHGKRADAIVKGMLQHSRSSNGVKEPTDINALADEYLRLAYHGLRAKDKSFNATLKTDFDETIGKIDIIPQDIGRVILNLITNAFYAVNERKHQQPEGYEPSVSVSTSRSLSSGESLSRSIGSRGEVLISVKDNGNGIPQDIVDKIFQPFFTTKPTGQGTGLGLSLSYDIVKAHGGELKVMSKEGSGSEFIIVLPSDLIKTL